MSIVRTFNAELFGAVHDFAGDTLKLALFTIELPLSTTVYAATDELVSDGYTAGGQALSVTSSVNGLGGTEFVLGNLTWTGAMTGTVKSALVYNSSKGDKAIAVLPVSDTILASPGLTFYPPTPFMTSQGAG